MNDLEKVAKSIKYYAEYHCLLCSEWFYIDEMERNSNGVFSRCLKCLREKVAQPKCN